MDSTEKEIENQSLIHIGVEDFSFHRGVDFGTVICDLKMHRPVELVTRNRATTYTKAIHSTNPDIIQIVYKWQFLKNLLDVVKDIISSRFPKGWFTVSESSVIEIENDEIDTQTINEDTELNQEPLSEKEQSKWTLILEVQKFYNK